MVKRLRHVGSSTSLPFAVLAAFRHARDNLSRVDPLYLRRLLALTVYGVFAVILRVAEKEPSCVNARFVCLSNKCGVPGLS